MSSSDKNMKPNHIFSNQQLREMTKLAPKSVGDLAKISGVGSRRISTFGKRFVDVIRKFVGAEGGAAEAQVVEISKSPYFASSQGGGVWEDGGNARPQAPEPPAKRARVFEDVEALLDEEAQMMDEDDFRGGGYGGDGSFSNVHSEAFKLRKK